jgi:hypothetical protein
LSSGREDGDLLRIQILRNRRGRRVSRIIAAVQARRIVNRDVENLLERILGEELDFLVTIAAQALEFSKGRGGAIVRQSAEIFAILGARRANARRGQRH